MTTITMYAASVPLFQRMLGGLSGVLRKGAAFAEARKIDETVLLQARLAPDMFPLVRQVQIATDSAKGGCARLAGVAVPVWADTEASFAELQARLTLALDFVGGFTPAQIDGSEAREIVQKMRDGELRMPGLDYLMMFTIPNVLFHCATAYDILRHNGVEVGKRDFLNAT